MSFMNTFITFPNQRIKKNKSTKNKTKNYLPNNLVKLKKPNKQWLNLLTPLLTNFL